MQNIYLLSRECSDPALSGKVILIRPEEEIPSDIRESEVILDWDCYKLFRKSYSRLYNAKKILFRFGDILIDMSNDEQIESARQKALTECSYKRCKTINRALIEYSVIRRREDTRCMPAEIQLETTDICNAKCIMCSHFYRQGSHVITKNREIISALKDVLPFLETIYLHGNGEPFLAEDIDEYVAEINSYGIHCTANTNLSMLTDENIRTIGSCFPELNVSVDGAAKEVYESIRHGLSFEKLVENCRRLRKSCPDLYMRMWSVMMRQNINSLPELVRFAAELGFDEIVFTELSSDERLNNKEDMASRYPHVVKRQIDKARETAIVCGIKLTAPDYQTGDNREDYAKEQEEIDSLTLMRNGKYYDDLSGKIRKSPDNCIKQCTLIGEQDIPCLQDALVRGICDWTVERPFIDLEGNVSVCCINQHFILGNILEQPFDEIWHGSSAANLRKCFYQGKLPYFCSGCEFMLQNSLVFMESTVSSKSLRSKLRFGEMQ